MINRKMLIFKTSKRLDKRCLICFKEKDNWVTITQLFLERLTKMTISCYKLMKLKTISLIIKSERAIKKFWTF